MKPYTVQKNPWIVPTTDGKTIKEYLRIASTNSKNISIAYMVPPAGWSEPFQTPTVDEYTLVIKGKKQCTINGEVLILEAGQTIKVNKHTRVQYSNPFEESCEYIAVCLPVFSVNDVNRED